MTSINIEFKNKPFLLKPVGKNYLWGGNRLNEEFNKNINMIPLAETWECSTHRDGSSIVNSGEHFNCQLSEVIKKNPQYLGTHPKSRGELPILIKFIDANQDLSIQVHPDDEYAFKNENESLGKTEMWYVLDAMKDTFIIYGFNHDVDKDELKNCIEKGTIEKLVKKIRIKKDDVFYIESGIVHAIGKGALIVEIQENSNVTYRLFDYNRLDFKGKKRQLNVDKALDVANLKALNNPRQPLRLLNYKRGFAKELLCRCEYFQVERLLINTKLGENEINFRTNSLTFQILLCLEGSGSIIDEDGNIIRFSKGECVFIPANSENLRLHGKSQILQIGC